MNEVNYLKKRLHRFSRSSIVFSSHAKLRMQHRQINEEEVIENILNPKRLDYAIRQKTTSVEERFDCYFGYSKTRCHRYIIALRNDIIIITVIKINKRWQKAAEKRLRK